MQTTNSWFPTAQRTRELASNVPGDQLKALVRDRKLERPADVTADMLQQLLPASGSSSATRWQACLEHPMCAEVAHRVVSQRVGGIIDASWRPKPIPPHERTGR